MKKRQYTKTQYTLLCFCVQCYLFCILCFLCIVCFVHYMLFVDSAFVYCVFVYCIVVYSVICGLWYLCTVYFCLLCTVFLCIVFFSFNFVGINCHGLVEYEIINMYSLYLWIVKSTALQTQCHHVNAFTHLWNHQRLDSILIVSNCVFQID
jgi:hypothetical protein